MSMQTCIHCNSSHNMHQDCNLTCSCGRPMSCPVTEVGKIDLKKVELECSEGFGYQGMYCYSRLTKDMKLNGRSVYADKESVMYQIKK